MIVRQLKGFSELEIVAAKFEPVGLFQLGEYLKVFAKNFTDKDKVILLEGEGGYGGFEVVKDKVMFLGMKPVLGKEEVTDYGDIVAEDYEQAWEGMLSWFKEKGYKKLQLDYVREDSETFKALKDKGKVMKQEVAPYIELTDSWEEYLESLERKHRKELRRKIKRLEEASSFYDCKKETVKRDFEEFVRLHRLSDPDKKKFMSEEMKQFFWEVKTGRYEGWWSNLCFLKMKNKPVAGVMSFESEKEVWLYNSGYDPEYSYYSVGLLLKAYKIKKAIEEGKKRFDFLRGGERYKYELGGKNLQLYRIEVGL